VKIDPAISSIHRKAVSVSQAGLIQAEPPLPGRLLPLVIQPTVKGVNLVTWAESNRAFIETHVLRHGALLFRNFTVSGVKDFEQFIQVISGGALEYRFRASPRTQVGNNIYSSTEYPADQRIFPHNEHAFSPVVPLHLYFLCVTPAQQGGETPIGDTREVTRSIDPAIIERFRQRKVMYVRNYGDGFGLPWQTVFQTTDKAEVETYCRRVGIEVEWKAGDRLRTRQLGPALVRHPGTGEPVWFNHATFFHVSTLEPTIREALLAEFEEEDLPQNTYYGDGSPIESTILEELREAYRRAMITFSWQRGDVMLLDNILVLHAREPYIGPRTVVVGMATALRIAELEFSTEEIRL
jgi:alpha-ketoglutarate-dependent taurine dioxygenase